MSGTRSVLFESIQQSPIDPLMVDETIAIFEENPLTPPLESAQDLKLRFLNPETWLDQLGSSTLRGQNGVVVVARKKTEGITATRQNDSLAIDISLNGLDVLYNGKCFHLSDQISQVSSIPIEVLELLSQTYDTVAAWRSRVVRLSMDTDEYECSLMDDLCPPRTFLVEFKSPTTVRSVRIQSGFSYWQLTSGKLVTVSVPQLEQQDNLQKWIRNSVPELAGVEIEHIWADLIQLRGICLDEDRRLSKAPTSNIGPSGG